MVTPIRTSRGRLMRQDFGRLIRAGAMAVSVIAVAGCGGGGGDTPAPAPATTAEGTYRGTITNSPSASAFSAIVLEDGQFWTAYGNSVGGGLVVSGLIQGQGTSSNGSFTSSTVKDFGAVPALAGTLSATYVSGVSLSGTITAGGSTVGFNGTAVPAAEFNYNAPASLSSVVGNWNLSSTSGDAIALAVAANGTFTGTATGGCSVSGTVAPRPSGKNVFNIQFTNGPAPCELPGWSGGGIGLYTTLSNGTHQLTVAVVDVSRTYGSVAFGTR